MFWRSFFCETQIGLTDGHPINFKNHLETDTLQEI